MATFQVLNGSGINGAGVNFGSLGQVGWVGMAGFPNIGPTEGLILYNDLSRLTFTGVGMSFTFPSTYNGIVFELTYDDRLLTPTFSISGFVEPLDQIINLFSGGDELVVLANLFSGNDSIGGSTEPDRLLGFDGADSISGVAGNDVLEGGGGADTLAGGADVDTAQYGGSAAGVTVALNLAGPQISLGDAAGDTLTGIENLFGSLFADSLTGDAGGNFLNDGGVGGADTLTGGLGDDTYAVYNAGAVIVETAGEGIDRVAAGADYVLADGVSIERLNTTSLGATYAVNLTGNDLVQLVRGNDGANVLDGRGGADQLFGEGGADAFRFSTALGAGNVDRIGDFSVADDQIRLDRSVFDALDLGPLADSAFKDNATSPKDADDRIFYNSVTGSLFYDADGSGAEFAAVKFASLAAGLALSAADFEVVQAS